MTKSLFNQFAQHGGSRNYAQNLPMYLAELTGKSKVVGLTVNISGVIVTDQGPGAFSDGDLGNYIIIAGTSYEIVAVISATVVYVDSAPGNGTGISAALHYRKNLEDDLNYIRSQLHLIIGETNWYDQPNATLSGVRNELDTLTATYIGFPHELETFAVHGVNQEPTTTVTGTGATDLQTVISGALDGDVIEVATNAVYDPIVLPSNKALVIRGSYGYAPKISGDMAVIISDGTRDTLVARFSFPDCDVVANNGNSRGHAISNEWEAIFEKVVFYQCSFLEGEISLTNAIVITYHQTTNGDEYFDPPIYPDEFSKKFGLIECEFFHASKRPVEGASVVVRGVDQFYMRGCKVDGDDVDSRGVLAQVCKNVWIDENELFGFGSNNSEAIKLDNIGGSTEITTATILNNICHDCVEGIDADDYVSALIQGNQCYNCQDEGIVMNSNTTGLIIGNITHNCGDGIRVNAGTNSVELYRNTSFDNLNNNYLILNGYTLDSSNVESLAADLHAPYIHNHNDLYYTESEIDNLITTTSGDIVSQIPTNTFIDLTDTYVDGDAYTDNNMLYTSSSGVHDTSDMIYDPVTGDIQMGAAGSARIVVDADSKTTIYGDDDTYMTVSGTNADFIEGGTLRMSLTSSGLALQNGARVNNILNTADGDSITTVSTDEQLASAKLIYDEISTLSGTFVDLTDTPADYSGADGQYVTVNAGGTALVFSDSLNKIFEDSEEPTGFVNTTDSTLTFNDGTETLTVSGISFDYYIQGIKYTINGAKSQLISTSGTNYFYLDDNEDLLVVSVFDSTTLLKDNAYVAVVYWDDIDNKHIYFGEERHGITWDWNLHSYHHLTDGTKYQSGLGLIDVVVLSSFEQIYNADSPLWDQTTIASFFFDFVVSDEQNHTTGGNFSLDFSGSEDGDICQFARGSYLDTDNFNALTGWIYITGWGGGDDITIYGYDTIADAIVGNSVNLSDYVIEATQDVWQEFTVPLEDMALVSGTINAIRIGMVGVGQPPSGFLDDLIFHFIPTSSDADLKFGVGSGIIRDEDLPKNISQINKGDSDYAVLYREGNLGKWTHDGVTDILFKNFSGGSGRVAWNEYTGTTWQQSEVADNEYTLVHVFATNDIEQPIVGVQAQRTFADIATARSEIIDDINNIITGDMPFEEFLPIGSLVILTSNDIANTYNASFIYIDPENETSWQDFRTIKGASTGTTSISNHSGLSNLSSDDHLQYHTDTRGDARYYLKIEVDDAIHQHYELDLTLSGSNVWTVDDASVTSLNTDNMDVYLNGLLNRNHTDYFTALVEDSKLTVTFAYSTFAYDWSHVKFWK